MLTGLTYYFCIPGEPTCIYVNPSNQLVFSTINHLMFSVKISHFFGIEIWQYVFFSSRLWTLELWCWMSWKSGERLGFERRWKERRSCLESFFSVCHPPLKIYRAAKQYIYFKMLKSGDRYSQCWPYFERFLGEYSHAFPSSPYVPFPSG